MKPALLFLSLILFSFGAYSQSPLGQKNADAICDSPNCVKYYKIWKHLFMKKNGASEEWFNKHIHITNTEIIHRNDNDKVFMVQYNVTIDWLTCKQDDRFLVYVGSASYPQLTFEKRKYINETEIEEVLSAYPQGNSVTAIDPVEHLKYATAEEANIAGHVPGGDKRYLQHCHISFGGGKGGPQPANHPYLFSYYPFKTQDTDNPCRAQTTDLVTGDIVIKPTPCFHDDP